MEEVADIVAWEEEGIILLDDDRRLRLVGAVRRGVEGIVGDSVY